MRFVGEGQLGWVDSMGGQRVVFPVVVSLLALAIAGVLSVAEPFALALGALVPIWYGWRMGVHRSFLHVVRNGRARFRVELDDLGVRTFDAAGHPTIDLEWFELDRYFEADHGLVLMLRVAKKGVNAVFAPKAFFSTEEWARLRALVREKLPGAAKATDEAAARAKVDQEVARRRMVRYGLIVIVLASLMLWQLTRP